MSMRYSHLTFIVALLVLGLLCAPAAQAQGETTIPLQIEGETAAPYSYFIDLMIFDGEIYLEQGDYLRAAAIFTRVTTYAPDRSYAHLLLGRALTSALVNNQIQDVEGAASEAVRQYRWVLNHDPGNREAHEGMAIELLGLLPGDGGPPHHRSRAQILAGGPAVAGRGQFRGRGEGLPGRGRSRAQGSRCAARRGRRPAAGGQARPGDLGLRAGPAPSPPRTRPPTAASGRRSKRRGTPPRPWSTTGAHSP